MSTGDQFPNVTPTEPTSLDEVLTLYFRAQLDGLHREELRARATFWSDTYKLIRNVAITWTVLGAGYVALYIWELLR